MNPEETFKCSTLCFSVSGHHLDGFLWTGLFSTWWLRLLERGVGRRQSHQPHPLTHKPRPHQDQPKQLKPRRGEQIVDSILCPALSESLIGL